MAENFEWVKSTSVREHVFAEYRRIRDLMLAERVEKARSDLFADFDMPRAARAIGIDVSFDEKAGRPSIDLDNDQQLDILLDYAMMFDSKDARPLRYEFIRRHERSEDEGLRAISKLYSDYSYAWLRPLRTKANFGVHCEDLLSGREVFLVDRGLSQTLTKESSHGLATGIHPFGDPALGCVMTGGAGLPFSLENAMAMLEEMLIDLKIEKRPPMSLDEKETARFVAKFLHGAMRSGISDYVRYE